MATTNQFTKMILDNKNKLDRVDFKVKVGTVTTYKFIIHDIKKKTLNIVVFIRYEDMVAQNRTIDLGFDLPVSPLEKQLLKTISSDANSVFDLKIATKVKKPELFKENVLVTIENKDYNFKITGAGEEAIKLSHKITFEDINRHDDGKFHPLENKVKNIIYYISSDRKQTWDMTLFEIIQLL